ncbi:hypothetical protein TeGR_g8281, partial [Tetraparma gracilis]
MVPRSASCPPLDQANNYDDFGEFRYEPPRQALLPSFLQLPLLLLFLLASHKILFPDPLNSPLQPPISLLATSLLRNLPKAARPPIRSLFSPFLPPPLDIYRSCPEGCSPRSLKSLREGLDGIRADLELHEEGLAGSILGSVAPHFSSRSRARFPLVLAFAGPTGTGKSVAAVALARQYSHPSLLRRRIVSHFLTCLNGAGVVVIDGLEQAERKFALFLVDILAEIGATGKLTYYATPADRNYKGTADNIDAVGSEVVTVEIAQMVVVLITDIGSDVIIRQRIADHDAAAADPAAGALGDRLRTAIENHFDGSVVPRDLMVNVASAAHPLSPHIMNNIVAFPPLTAEQVERAVGMKLLEVEAQGREGGLWAQLVVEEGAAGVIMGGIKGFFVAGAKGDLTLSKYGGHEVERNGMLLGISGA